MATWSTEFSSVVIVDNCIAPNHTEVTIDFEADTENAADQLTFVRRMEMLFGGVLDRCTSVDQDNPLTATVMEQFDTVFMTLPGPMYDGKLAEVLHAKLTALAEGKFSIMAVTVASELGHNVAICYDAEYEYSDITPLQGKVANPPWWHRSDLSIDDFSERQDANWEEIGLAYEDVKPAFNIAKKKMGLSVIDGGRPKGDK